VTVDLSPGEASQQTGLSRTLVYRETEHGDLSASEVGDRLRITRTALAEWKRTHADASRARVVAYEPARVKRGSDTFAADLRTIQQESAA
jgi:excisionase family DNA binding protein